MDVFWLPERKIVRQGIRRSSWSSAASESEFSLSPTHPRPYLTKVILLAKPGEAMLCGLQIKGGKQRKSRSKPKQNRGMTRTISQKVFQLTFSWNLPSKSSKQHFPKNYHENHRYGITENIVLGVPQLRHKSKLYRRHRPGVSANLSAASTSCEAVACKADLHRDLSALYELI